MPSSLLKSELAQSRASIFGAAAARESPLGAVRAYAGEVDRVLGAIFQGLPRPDSACLVALGGYGRRELCPHSDVDILVLHDGRGDDEGTAALVRRFWDLGLLLGCVVRTLGECAALLGQDLATDTALLEGRPVAGNRKLFERLQRESIRPFFHKRKKAYIDEICADLHSHLFSCENTLYRVEPDLKNGICTLRDCQRLLWAERVRQGAAGPRGFRLPGCSAAAAREFEAGYAFLTGLRSELHLAAAARLDILETGLQPAIGERYGYGPHGAGALMERFYRTVREIRLFLLAFLEEDLSGKRIWSLVRKRITANRISPSLSVLDGILFDAGPEPRPEASPSWIMNVFRSAMLHRATLSVELRNKVRRLAAQSSPDDFRTEAVNTILREILSRREPAGPVFQMMHEAGVLEKLIPQFGPLTCKVEYDSYHEFTIDQHILLALCAVDSFAADPDAGLREIHAGLGDLLTIRTAVLLHDVGKAQPGDHSTNGAIIAQNICDRLGFEQQETERLTLLIYHHLELSRLSLRREPDDAIIRKFARTVGNRENLDLLYLLTVADIRSVGPNTWTHWKGFQLERLYSRTRQQFEGSGARSEASPRPSGPVLQEAYDREVLPEDREKHCRWLAELGGADLSLHHEQFAGFERLTACGEDRPGFLCDLIGCISSEGYNVLNAQIYSTRQGQALDIFYLEAFPIPSLSPAERLGNIRRKWDLVRRKEVTADELVAERVRRYPLPPLRRIPEPSAVPLIRIDNNESPDYTILEIETEDNFGLLHRIARCLNRSQIDIASARLSTRAHRAFDVFYIRTYDGTKLAEPTRIEALKGSLTEALGREKITTGSSPGGNPLGDSKAGSQPRRLDPDQRTGSSL